MSVKELTKEYIKASANFFIRKQKVAMLHTGRCGSTVLGDLMNQHPQMYWSGEPFERLMKLDKSLSIKEVDYVIKEHENKRISAIYSFATKYPTGMHLSKDCINMKIGPYIEHLKSLGYKKFILIERSNHLKRIVSIEKGRVSGLWHSSNEVNKTKKVVIDPLKFEVGINVYLTLNEYFKQLDDDLAEVKSNLNEQEFVCINYENDINNDPKVAYKKVCDFTGIEYKSPQVKLKKTNPFPLHQLIENYEEIKEYFEGSKYAWMLDE